LWVFKEQLNIIASQTLFTYNLQRAARKSKPNKKAPCDKFQKPSCIYLGACGLLLGAFKNALCLKMREPSFIN